MIDCEICGRALRQKREQSRGVCNYCAYQRWLIHSLAPGWRWVFKPKVKQKRNKIIIETSLPVRQRESDQS